jgi:hypothetical protein
MFMQRVPAAKWTSLPAIVQQQGYNNAILLIF